MWRAADVILKGPCTAGSNAGESRCNGCTSSRSRNEPSAAIGTTPCLDTHRAIAR